MGADRIQPGPLSSAGTNQYDQQALIQDTLNNTLSVSGSGRKIAALRSSLLALGPQTALTAITTAQTLLSLVINGGFLNVTGRTVKVKGTAIYSSTAANVATLSFALILGGVTLCTITTAATNTTASANLPIQFEFEISLDTLGATGTLESHGRVEANLGTAAAAAVTVFLDTNVAPSSAVDLLTNDTLSVAVAASAAVPSLQLRSATIEVVA